MTEKTKERLIEELKAEIEVLKRRQSHLADAKNSVLKRLEESEEQKNKINDSRLRKNRIIESLKKALENEKSNKERQDLQKQKDSNSMKSFETPEVIQELLNTISKQRKKAKKYKRMYQDARKANFKLQQQIQ